MFGANDNDNDTEARTQSFIGIAVAIGGNVLISLALNCQKLAHQRLELQHQHEAVQGDAARGDHLSRLGLEQGRDETHPLIANSERPTQYTRPLKTRARPRLPIPRSARSPLRHSEVFRSPVTVDEGEDAHVVAIEVPSEDASSETLTNRNVADSLTEEEQQKLDRRNETDYLRSKLWWFGFLLMNVGEFGNFLSYAYAPASVVAPLGTVALIANCLFAPLMLKERLLKRDLVGIVLAIFGAVTIVGTGRQSDVRLDHAGLIHAITQKPFIIYSIVCVVLVVAFIVLSEGPAGRKWVFVDIGLCALFGGYTVLATKAVSTLVSLHWIHIFKDWVVYPVAAVLIVTGVGQIKYLNRALMKFDSKVVIPTFFVSFNLSAIVGSAILYGDFRDVRVHQFTTFLYGIATTFVGVFFLTHSTAESGADPERPVLDSETGTGDGGNMLPNVPRAVVMVPSLRGRPVVRPRNSSTSLGISPGQYLLLAASPPREDRAQTVRNGGGLNAESPTP